MAMSFTAIDFLFLYSLSVLIIPTIPDVHGTQLGESCLHYTEVEGNQFALWSSTPKSRASPSFLPASPWPHTLSSAQGSLRRRASVQHPGQQLPGASKPLSPRLRCLQHRQSRTPRETFCNCSTELHPPCFLFFQTTDVGEAKTGFPLPPTLQKLNHANLCLTPARFQARKVWG